MNTKSHLTLALTLLVLSGLGLSYAIQNLNVSPAPLVLNLPSGRSQTAALSGTGSGLVAYYTFDDGVGTTASDSSGNGNTATLTNGPVWTTGKVGGGLQFDGIDDYVNLKNSFNTIGLSTTKTISAWIKPDVSATGLAVCIARTYGQSCGFGITPVTNWKGSYWTTTAGSLNTSSAVVAGKWTHAVLVQSGSSVNLYIDGALAGTGSGATGVGAIASAVIGARPDLASGTYFRGTIDDVRIYDRSLSASEVSELYAYSGGGTTGGTTTPPPITTIDPVPLTSSNTCASVSQYGITWTFDKAYPCGTFANGDYWIVGPAIITSITPDYDGTKNGWEVNPASGGINSTMKQGFDQATEGFNPALVPALPYTAKPGESIVKSTRAVCYPTCSGTTSVLETAAVLTILSSIPPDNGATVFRPPYVGTNKPLYRTTALRTSLLPSLAPVDVPPTLDSVYLRFNRVQLDHYYAQSVSWRNLHPRQNMPDYGGDIGRRNSDMLRLFLNDSLSAKMPALVAYVQYGIDLLHMSALGQNWQIGGSGHKPGQLLPMTFAAVMLNDATLKSYAQASRPEESISTYVNPQGVALFGQVEGWPAELNYWTSVAQSDGFKTRKDPYMYVDGGYLPGTSYQAIITPVFRSEVLAFDLIPEMKTVWSKPDFFEYVHRSMDLGVWSQPDPCAPYDGNMANYGITFGPNGSGGCILDTNPADGVGRFPTRHGLQFMATAYRTSFQDAMWNSYHTSYSTTPPPVNPTTYTLTVTKSGTGQGTVSSSVGGISCGTSCTSTALNSGTAVTLTATPASGSTFGGWSGACSGTSTCSITLSSNTSVGASFTLIPTTTPVTSNKFIIGDRVHTTSNLKVRSTANGTLLGTQKKGSYGTVTAGPVTSGNYIWWNVNFDAGVDGWSAENWLVK
jgi:hypothetical protein